jgi:hypothetical protein
MRNCILILGAAFILLFSNAYSQSGNGEKSYAASTQQFENLKKVPEELNSNVTSFFDKLMKNDIDQAFKELLKNSIINDNQDQVQVLIDETRKSGEVYGSMKGFEPYGAEIISPSMIRLKYLALHKDFPMRWIFSFYKSPENGWLVINVKFDDNTEEVFSGN